MKIEFFMNAREIREAIRDMAMDEINKILTDSQPDKLPRIVGVLDYMHRIGAECQEAEEDHAKD